MKRRRDERGNDRVVEGKLILSERVKWRCNWMQHVRKGREIELILEPRMSQKRTRSEFPKPVVKLSPPSLD